MRVSVKLLQRSLLVSGLLALTSTVAMAWTIERKSIRIDDAFVPVLVAHDGKTEVIHRVGEDGLTRRIMYDRRLALTWAKGLYGPEADLDEDSFYIDNFPDSGGSKL
ncbi:MAG: hypothetical protein B7Z10_06745 [Rhodobacterales bacterium 32-66-7]|nr:MAG: hypothetical protein B7Z10_06745 [Rhodobacterales bacterium 32-66-7]OZA07598.1 MAG: hypothetical protein B7Y02_13695 [Rhodobacterales bacterium 17-64-5]